jgi:hypothetical protein
MRGLAVLLLALAGCSSRTPADCEAIAAEIRKGAAARGLSPNSVCNSPAPAAADLKPACDELRKCNEEVDDL